MGGEHLEMASNQAERTGKWAGLASESACITGNRHRPSAAVLNALGISAAC